MLIDDEPFDLELMGMIHRQAGIAHPLQTFDDPRVAIACLRSAEGRRLRPALVFTDLRMPVLSGLDVLYALRSEPTLRSVPVILLTSAVLREDVRRAQALGANGFFAKFPLPAALADLVARAADGRLAGDFLGPAGP